MIYLITGAVNQGKSTYLYGVYNRLQTGDGFYNRRIYQGNCFAGQEIVRLTTGESRLFSYTNQFIPNDKSILEDEECRFDVFSFSRQGLDFGRNILRNALDNHFEPVFIDEIGPLELAEKGFYEIFRDMAGSPIEIYAVVRKNCLKEVIAKFLITGYREIEVK